MSDSFEEYKRNYAETHSFSMHAKCILGDACEDEIDDLITIMYYREKFGEDSNCADEQLLDEKKRLIDFANRLIEENINKKSLDELYGDFYFVIGLLLKLKDVSDVVKGLEERFIEKKIEQLNAMSKTIDFESFFEINLNNIKLYNEHISDTGFIPVDYAVWFQKSIFNKKHKEVIQLGMERPGDIIRWFIEIKIMYKLIPNKYKYKELYCALLQMSIQKSKDMNRFDLMSEFIIEREELITRWTKNGCKKYFRRYILEKVLGYGEKLENIVISLLIFGIIMTFIYMNIDLQGMPEYGLERLVAAIYFFFTTSFTIGYGDISPNTTMARLIVMFNQIIGFFLSGSLVALYLRKWFRD